jgi:hypothetical protein
MELLKNNVIAGLTFFSIIMINGCSSSRLKEDFMEDYGFVCPSKLEKDQVKGLKTEKINGKTCVKIKVDKDPASDYYLREWQRDSLPEMPKL